MTAQRDRAVELKAVERIEKFLHELGKFRGIDRERIHGMHTGTDRECELRASDLHILLSALAETAPGEPVAWRRRVWVPSNRSPWHYADDAAVVHNVKVDTEWEPLYASPPLAPERAEDRMDAERWRKAMSIVQCGGATRMGGQQLLDAAIAAMQAGPKGD